MRFGGLPEGEARLRAAGWRVLKLDNRVPAARLTQIQVLSKQPMTPADVGVSDCQDCVSAITASLENSCGFAKADRPLSSEWPPRRNFAVGARAGEGRLSTQLSRSDGYANDRNGA